MSLRSVQNRTRHEAMTRSGAVVAFDYDSGMWFGVLTDKTTTKQGMLKHEVTFGDTPQSVLTKPSKRDSARWFGTRMIKAAAIKAEREQQKLRVLEKKQAKKDKKLQTRLRALEKQLQTNAQLVSAYDRCAKKRSTKRKHGMSSSSASSWTCCMPFCEKEDGCYVKCPNGHFLCKACLEGCQGPRLLKCIVCRSVLS